jgi:hypothetical protein
VIARNVAEWEKLTGRKWWDDYVPFHRRSSLPWERHGLFEHLMTPPRDIMPFGRKLQGLAFFFPLFFLSFLLFFFSGTTGVKEMYFICLGLY